MAESSKDEGLGQDGGSREGGMISPQPSCWWKRKKKRKKDMGNRTTGKRCWPVLLAVAVLLSVIAGLLAFVLAEYFHPVDDEDSNGWNGPQVELGGTTYVGQYVADDYVSQFLGIPYAQPPLGNLRWRAPVPPEPARGFQTAQEFRDICLATSAQYPVQGQSEDCLYVNIWKPANATAGSKLPVWFFIQGGGYTQNANANYNGSGVVTASNNNIVFVNFNYRVGVFGFLASERVRADGDLNAGFLDQRLLLNWVKDNIAKFGGDPDHVVIHGLSAGAGSVALHLTAYGGKDEGLFVGAAIESVFFPAQPYVAALEWQFDKLAEQAGCGNVTDQMCCLRDKDTATLQPANVAFPFPGRTEAPLPLFYWTPCIDGDLIPELPYDMFDKGNFIKVPVIVGDDENEGSVFAYNASTADEVRNFMANNYPLLTDNQTVAIIQEYPLMPPLPEHAAWFPSASAAYGEATFTCAGMAILDAFQRFGPAVPSWSYRTDIYDDQDQATGYGCPHTYEISAILGPANVIGAASSFFSYNAPLVPVIMDYWISFVRHLSPNPGRSSAAPEWDTWTALGGAASGAHSRVVFELDNNRMEIVPAAQESRCTFWKSLSTVMEQK